MTASDFDLPERVMEALGIESVDMIQDGLLVEFTHKGTMLDTLLRPPHATAFILGLIAEKYDDISIFKRGDSQYAAWITNGHWEHEAVGSTRLEAAVSAFNAALKAQEKQ
jgi:hypothetical protein